MGKCILCDGKTSFWSLNEACDSCGLNNTKGGDNRMLKSGQFIFRFSGNTKGLEIRYPPIEKVSFFNSDKVWEKTLIAHKEEILKKREKLLEKLNKVQEFKRTCNGCGKMWHSLVSREKELERGIKVNSFVVLGTAFSNIGAAAQARRNADASQETLNKLKKCPNCGSGNYAEEIIEYDKK